MAVNGYRATQQFSSNSLTQKLEVQNSEGQRSIAIVSKDASHLEQLFYVLQDVHAIAPVPGIPRPHGDGIEAVQLQGVTHHILIHSRAEGVPLDQWLMENDPPAMTLVLRWFLELVAIVGRLHSLNPCCLHRDIKPSNIIVAEDLSLTLIDFGSIKRMDLNPSIPAVAGDVSKTAGTVGYMAPEVSDGRHSVVSDYYSIGRTMIHIATGTPPDRLPWSADKGLAWKDQAPTIEPILANFIDRFCTSNPLQRPQSVQDIQAYLEAIPRRSRARKILRSPVFRAVAGAAGMALLGLGGWGLMTLASLYELQWLTAESRRFLLDGDYLPAIELLQKAIAIDPLDPLLKEELALACASIGKLECAESAIKSAAESMPEDQVILYNLANIYELTGDNQSAEAIYLQVSQSSGFIKHDAANNLARLQILDGRPEEAILLLQEHMDQTEDAVSRAAFNKNMGWALYQQGRILDAIIPLQESIELNPERPDAFCLISVIKKTLEQNFQREALPCLQLQSTQTEVEQWRIEILQDFRVEQEALITLKEGRIS